MRSYTSIYLNNLNKKRIYAKDIDMVIINGEKLSGDLINYELSDEFLTNLSRIDKKYFKQLISSFEFVKNNEKYQFIGSNEEFLKMMIKSYNYLGVEKFNMCIKEVKINKLINKLFDVKTSDEKLSMMKNLDQKNLKFVFFNKKSDLRIRKNLLKNFDILSYDKNYIKDREYAHHLYKKSICFQESCLEWIRQLENYLKDKKRFGENVPEIADDYFEIGNDTKMMINIRIALIKNIDFDEIVFLEKDDICTKTAQILHESISEFDYEKLIEKINKDIGYLLDTNMINVKQLELYEFGLNNERKLKNVEDKKLIYDSKKVSLVKKMNIIINAINDLENKKVRKKKLSMKEQMRCNEKNKLY